MNFPSNTTMTWKHSGKLAYQKLDSDEWGNWRSLEYDLDKPLKDRWGWRWTDNQVYEYYKNIMEFNLPSKQ